MSLLGCIFGLLSLVLPVSGAEVTSSGHIELDGRLRLEDVGAGEWHSPAGMSSGFERFDSTIGGRLEIEAADWLAIIEGRAVAKASSSAGSLGELSQRNQAAPVSIEVDEAVIELWDVGLSGLDLKIGHQVVQWGVGDQFNPTNTLNPERLDDILRFGDQLPNMMLRSDYAMGAMWTLSGVVVPIFRPSTLPQSADIGLAFTDRIPVIEDGLRRELQAQRNLANALGFPTIVDEANVVLPPASLENMAGMIRLAGAVGMTDLAVSWYTGRSDMPQPVGNTTSLVHSPRCHPNGMDDCINGYLMTDVDLAYPKMHVAGFNGAGELELPGSAPPIGWRAEVAWVIPERTTLVIQNNELDFGSFVQPAGELEYGLGGERPSVVSGKSFAKWTLGLDYSLGKFVYLNTQWVHGMTDEFGHGDFLSPAYTTRSAHGSSEIRRLRIGDYLVLGTEIILGGPTLRLFSIIDLTGYQIETQPEGSQQPEISYFGPASKKGRSVVFFPELMVDLGEGLNLGVGAVLLVGESHTKFGDAAAGGNLGFVRLKYAF